MLAGYFKSPKPSKSQKATVTGSVQGAALSGLARKLGGPRECPELLLGGSQRLVILMTWLGTLFKNHIYIYTYVYYLHQLW